MHQQSKGRKDRDPTLQRLDFSVGPDSSVIKDGIDRIAIVSGPHRGQIVRTQKSEVTIKVTEHKSLVTYRREFNPITGGFYFEFDRVKEC